MRDTLDQLKIPYRIFGHDSAMSEVVNYAMKVDEWMVKEGRKLIKQQIEPTKEVTVRESPAEVKKAVKTVRKGNKRASVVKT
jgi:hypothetical protein